MSDKDDKNEEGVGKNTDDDAASSVESVAEEVQTSVDAAQEAAKSASDAIEDAVETVTDNAAEVVDKTVGAANTAIGGTGQTGGMLPLLAIIGLVIFVGGSLYYVLTGSSDGPAPVAEKTAPSKPSEEAPPAEAAAEAPDRPAEAAAEAPKPPAPDPEFAISDLMETGPLSDNVIGSTDAPVTIIEYSSMTCPHCANFHKNTLPGLKEKYIDTGKVRYIMREFPFDNLAAAAFMLGRCVSTDKYFPFIDALFASQEKWAYGQGDPTPRLFDATKKAGAGFTNATFESCLQRQDLLDGINWVRERGANKFKVQSTPSFFINGVRLVGSQPLEKFEEMMKPYL